MRDGSTHRYTGTYTLRRAVVDGATRNSVPGASPRHPARRVAVIEARWSLLPLLLLAACAKEHAAPPNRRLRRPRRHLFGNSPLPSHVGPSASLAGVAEDADATRLIWPMR